MQRKSNGRRRSPQPPGRPPNPSGLCQCGCGQKTAIAKRTSTRDGSVRGHPNRYVNSVHAVASTMTLYIENENGCWIWQRRLNHKGYGTLYDKATNRCRMAHRVIYERHHGFPLPAGRHLHHLCGVKSCVNPDHLEVVSPNEHGGAKEVRTIRKLVEGGVAPDLVAHAFEMTHARVRQIVADR